MAREITFQPTKTYKTLTTMNRAIESVPGNHRYLVLQTTEGRYYPVFIGEKSYHLVHSGFCNVPDAEAAAKSLAEFVDQKPT